MFEHVGFRSAWPALVLLPWFFIGVGYLLTALRHGRSPSAAAHSRDLWGEMHPAKASWLHPGRRSTTL